MASTRLLTLTENDYHIQTVYKGDYEQEPGETESEQHYESCFFIQSIVAIFLFC